MIDFKRTIFSPDRLYRYTLWREWDMHNPEFCNFICLNPSTADETMDDPTIRRCIGFSKRWGFGAFCMTNLFAFRATLPRDMMRASDPIGAENSSWIFILAKHASRVVLASGKDGDHLGRGYFVRRFLQNAGIPLFHLGTNQNGEPTHPLYLSAATLALPWT